MTTHSDEREELTALAAKHPELVVGIIKSCKRSSGYSPLTPVDAAKIVRYLLAAFIFEKH